PLPRCAPAAVRPRPPVLPPVQLGPRGAGREARSRPGGVRAGAARRAGAPAPARRSPARGSRPAPAAATIARPPAGGWPSVWGRVAGSPGDTLDELAEDGDEQLRESGGAGRPLDQDRSDGGCSEEHQGIFGRRLAGVVRLELLVLLGEA